MSQGNAAARKRRAPPEPVQTSIRPGQNPGQNAQQNIAPTGGLTLPQVIAVIDNRLIGLEKFMKDTKDENQNGQSAVGQQSDLQFDNTKLVEEFDNRFELLAEEISNLKDIVLKLQSYTMEVNKTLMDERINVFSDLGHIDQVQEDRAPAITFSLMNESEEPTSVLSSMNLRTLVNEEFVLQSTVA